MKPNPEELDKQLDQWEKEAIVDKQNSSIVVHETKATHTHEYILKLNDRIEFLIHEVRDWKNIAKGFHDDMEKKTEWLKQKDEALRNLFQEYCSLAESEFSPDWNDEEYMSEKWPLVAKTKEALVIGKEK